VGLPAAAPACWWYLAPHPLWDRDQDRNHRREVRLWAHVLDLRARDRRAGGLWLRVLQPTLGLLFAEAFGKLSFRSTWMYVTDGGITTTSGWWRPCTGGPTGSSFSTRRVTR